MAFKYGPNCDGLTSLSFPYSGEEFSIGDEYTLSCRAGYLAITGVYGY